MMFVLGLILGALVGTVLMSVVSINHVRDLEVEITEYQARLRRLAAEYDSGDGGIG